MTRRGALAALAGATALLFGCGAWFPARYRYRMTVEVMTPLGLRTASSVYEVEAYERTRLTSEEHSGGGAFRGQAIVIDLPDGPLFALIRKAGGDPIQDRVTQALSPDTVLKTVATYVAAVRQLGASWTSRKADLRPADWPQFIRFADLSDPRTMVTILPLAAGVTRVRVETTDAEVTTGIEKRIPWIDHLDRYRANPNNPFTSTVPGDVHGLRS